MSRENDGVQYPPDELAERRRAKAAKGEEKAGEKASQDREAEMLKWLSPEARATAKKVEEGKLALAELERIHEETEELEKSIRRGLNNLGDALSARGGVFERVRDEVRELIRQYQARPDLNEDDFKFIKTANERVDELEEDYGSRKAVRS